MIVLERIIVLTFDTMENEGRISPAPCNSAIFKVPEGTELPKKRRKNKRKKSKSKKQNQQTLGVKIHHNFKKNYRGTANMHSFTETFTKAATWQYKHQIAYWKAKAKALEFENRVLHDMIRKNHMSASSSSRMSTSETGSEIDSELDHSDDEHCPEADEDPDLEVSEDFIQFLAANAKYKEEARLERERLKAEQNHETEEDRIRKMEAPPEDAVEDRTTDLKTLYGSHWQNISALEMSLQAKFMSTCDRYKPNYWPNIPFNFNYS